MTADLPGEPPAVPPAPTPGYPVPPYGQVPPGYRPPPKRQVSAAQWAIILGTIIGVVIVVGGVALYATEPRDGATSPQGSASAQACPTPQAPTDAVAAVRNLVLDLESRQRARRSTDDQGRTRVAVDQGGGNTFDVLVDLGNCRLLGFSLESVFDTGRLGTTSDEGFYIDVHSKNISALRTGDAWQCSYVQWGLTPDANPGTHVVVSSQSCSAVELDTVAGEYLTEAAYLTR